MPNYHKGREQRRIPRWQEPLSGGVVPNLTVAKDRGRVQGVKPAKLVCAGNGAGSVTKARSDLFRVSTNSIISNY